MVAHKIRKHPIKSWEVSISEYKYDERIIYKVTRRLPLLSVAETEIFYSKEQAKDKFRSWLQ